MEVIKATLKKVDNGFSLVEFMLVVVILGFLVAVAVPVWDIFVSNSNLSAGARQVVTDIRDAQGEAMAEIKYSGIEFQVSGGKNTYSIYASQTVGDANLFAAAYLVATKTLPTGVFFNQTDFNAVPPGPNRLLFQKNGTTTTLGYIYIRSDRGKERKILLSETGKATLE